jgi:hypothetical protein
MTQQTPFLSTLPSQNFSVSFTIAIKTNEQFRVLSFQTNRHHDLSAADYDVAASIVIIAKQQI